jgi:radical SAM protein with 4Fe4S-binding SPASM domain
MMRAEGSDTSSGFRALTASARLTRPLDRIALQLTTYCNLQCKMCSVWEIRRPGVPLELAKQLLTDARELGARTFVPFGAESFMRKDFLEIVEHAHALGYWYQPIVTNGTMIDEAQLDRISRCPSVKLHISIDGPRPVHDELRGAGNFDKSTATARCCVERGIAVGLSGVILQETMPHLEALVDLAAELGIKEVSFQPFQTEISGPHKDLQRFSLNSTARDSIAARLAALAAHAARRKVWIFTEPLFGAVPDYLAYGKRPIPRGGCALPSKMLLIDYRGDIYPCFFMWTDADRMGNVYRDQLREVWHSAVHKQMQLLALTERCPGCLAACSDVESFADSATSATIPAPVNP